MGPQVCNCATDLLIGSEKYYNIELNPVVTFFKGPREKGREGKPPHLGKRNIRENGK